LATTLAPALVRTWLNAEGATGIVELRQTGPDLRPGADTVIGAHLAAARVSIEIDGTLPKAGFAALAAGTTDLVLTAGPDAAGDIAPLQAAGGPVAEHLLGYAAVAVIVPRSSRIGTLSIADVARLFDGTAASQAPFGGPPGGVALYAPPEEDPAEALFRALVMPAAPLARNRRVADPVTLDRLVAADPRAIGIVGPHAIHESRAVALGEANALPTDDEIRRGRYPLARPIRLYAQSAPASPAIRQFVAIAVSGAGQLTVAEAGLVAPGP
jgi:ABC-type phosphate transport system substrate-binding protein